MTRRWTALLLTLLAGATAMAQTMKPLLTWEQLTSRPRPHYSARIPYGADPLQHVDLWLPEGAGPHPVVVMVHGGCWQTEVAKADLMDWAADDLRRRGVAVWNIEYRGVDRPGGGYPGTFQDVAAATDALAGVAEKYQLKLDRVAVVGHSAGGHLALWLAARQGLPASSPLRTTHPLRLSAVVSLGGLPDLEAASVPPGDTCGPEVIPQLVGRPLASRPDVYADTSPARLPQPTIPVTLVNGERDRIAPPAFAEAYIARTGAKQRVIIPGEGHAELIAPGSAAWTRIAALLTAAVK